MWLGIKRIMPVEERVVPPTKICIIFHITRSPIQYICYWFSVSQWKSSTIWIFGANVKVYTCFFFIWGILWLYKYNWSCYCNCHCNYNIYTPIATKYRKQQKPKIKKNICSDCFADGLQQISREEGLVSLWSGTGPSLVLAGNPAIQFMVYEAIKKFLMEDNKKVCAVIPHQKNELNRTWWLNLLSVLFLLLRILPIFSDLGLDWN